jgi:HEAT repeat protein
VSDDEDYRPLTTKQLAAVSALCETGSVSEACRRSGVSERTMSRWLASSQFASAYRKATYGRHADAVASLRSASVEAVETLRRALEAESEEVRLRAAVAILSLAEKSALGEILARLSRSRRSKRTE